jgi:hypothetical protein
MEEECLKRYEKMKALWKNLMTQKITFALARSFRRSRQVHQNLTEAATETQKIGCSKLIILRGILAATMLISATKTPQTKENFVSTLPRETPFCPISGFCSHRASAPRYACSENENFANLPGSSEEAQGHGRNRLYPDETLCPP